MGKTPLPSSARIVIIGGGVSGVSVAYHLSKLGWKDIVLLERKQLTCGTTWHAAGLIGQLRASQNMTRLAKYSADLYVKLEEETGIATGMKQNGSISVALTDDRLEELQRQASMARVFDVEIHDIGPEEIKQRYPHMETGDVKGGVYIPHDGQCDPANIAMAFAKGARQNGAKIFEQTKVTEVHLKDGRVTGVSWASDDGKEQGTITSELVVNCAGMWGREFAAQSGVCLPLHACEHFYLITEPVEGLSQLPVLRIPDECAYYKEDAGKMMLGAFEPKAKPWGMAGIPDSFCFDSLPEDFEHFEPILEMAMHRLPLFSNAGIHTFFNGPESFTPDDRYYLGESPEVKGYWVAAGYNSVGIAGSGGAGMALAEWLDQGYPPFDLWEVDIRRAQPFQRNRSYLQARVSETLGVLYADHYPHRQMETARGIRRSPFHEQLKQAGACFGEVAGYERPNWYANAGENASYDYGWGRQNWFYRHEQEHLAVRSNIGLIDMSSFGKIRVEGMDAMHFLQRLCACNIDVAIGKIVYGQMLNAHGGIECDLTITRLGETSYLLIVPCATLQRDLNWLSRNRKEEERVTILDMTAGEAVLCVMGPNARTLLNKVSPADLSNDAHPFATARQIEIGMGLARAHRISYVGELGWELYIESDQAAHIFEILWEEAKGLNAKLCGIHALDSCRIEKAFRHFGHDISDEDHVLEAGLGFAVKPDKGDFIGRDAVLQKREQGLSKRLLQFKLDDPAPLLFHNEPIIRDGQIVSYTTSANYGHHLKGAIALGYIPATDQSIQDLLASTYHIEVAGTRHKATASFKPMYDPTSERMMQ